MSSFQKKKKIQKIQKIQIHLMDLDFWIVLEVENLCKSQINETGVPLERDSPVL